MPRKDRQAKSAAIALARELDSEMTDEQRERMEKSGMGIGGGLDKGEAVLFEKKLTKEEKKAAAEAKKLELAAKKAAKKREEAIANGARRACVLSLPPNVAPTLHRPLLPRVRKWIPKKCR